MQAEKNSKNKVSLGQIAGLIFKLENLILIVVALMAVVMGVLIINSTLTISPNAFLIGDYPLVFAWILVVLGSISLILVSIPLYAAAASEIKHIKGDPKSVFFGNIVKVITYIIILSFVFFLFDLAIEAVLGLFN